jgi:hypothetical protein
MSAPKLEVKKSPQRHEEHEENTKKTIQGNTFGRH